MSEKEYIEREGVCKVIAKELNVQCLSYLPRQCEIVGLKAVMKKIKKIPAADVVEVVHGEWLIKSKIYQMLDDVDEEIYVECPFCQRTFYVPYELDDEKIFKYAREHYPYCNCGAKMDKNKKS